MAYPPGGSVVTQIEVQRERRFAGYNTRSVPLVYPGQEVLPDQPVIRLEPGKPASQDQPGEPDVPIIPAGLRGQVVETTSRGGVVIKTRAAVLAGNIGAGQQAAGVLTLWQTARAQPAPVPPGAILAIAGPVDFALLRQAAASGVVGIVASSIETRDLEGFLGVDMFDLLNSIDIDMAQARLPSPTLLFTEGFGALPMPESTFQLLSRYQGSIALISGVTSTRYTIYPELIISLPIEEAQRNWQPPALDAGLRLGAHVRVCAGMHAGVTGYIEHFFVYQQNFLSGVLGRAARLRLADDSRLIVPIMNIERIP
ncbi:MAG TPA: hypothetical protein VKR83_00760 [Ktedonobacteraceae bacterium]|nr:hypothetical protein [Ktedonobacteraceae bacterium]